MKSTRRPRSELVRTLLALGLRSDDIVSTIGKSPAEGRHLNVESVDWYHANRFAPPQDWNCYFGLNPVRSGLPFGSRGKEVDVTRIVGLFADLDIKPGALGSLAECHKVVAKLTGILGIKPAVIIESGHGVQPIWQTANSKRSPNYISSTVEREQWKELLQRWGGLVQQMSSEVRPGSCVDGVYDLSRILRMPGSVNNKDPKAPVPVVTRIDPESRSVQRSILLRALDTYDAQPIKPSSNLPEAVPTTRGEAWKWVDKQKGSSATVPEMLALGRYRSMLDQRNYDELVAMFRNGTDEESSAYNLMRNRVLYVVLLSTENRAGLALALDFIKRAYLEVMELRRAGLASGDARSDAEALSAFERALQGAVGRARSRGTSPEPQRDSDGRIVVRHRVDSAVSEA